MDVVAAVRVMWTALGAEEELWRLLPSKYKYATCKAPFRGVRMPSPALGLACCPALPPAAPSTADAPGMAARSRDPRLQRGLGVLPHKVCSKSLE